MQGPGRRKRRPETDRDRKRRQRQRKTKRAVDCQYYTDAKVSGWKTQEGDIRNWR